MKLHILTAIAITLGSLAMSAHATPDAQALEGRWGGDRMSLFFTEGSARVELECARGTIQGPVKLSPEGRFEASGQFERLRGGPTRADAAPPPPTARYVGTLQGQTLTLEVVAAPGEPAETFKLRKGAVVKMVRCY